MLCGEHTSANTLTIAEDRCASTFTIEKTRAAVLHWRNPLRMAALHHGRCHETASVIRQFFALCFVAGGLPRLNLLLRPDGIQKAALLESDPHLLPEPHRVALSRSGYIAAMTSVHVTHVVVRGWVLNSADDPMHPSNPRGGNNRLQARGLSSQPNDLEKISYR